MVLDHSVKLLLVDGNLRSCPPWSPGRADPLSACTWVMDAPNAEEMSSVN